MNRKAAKKTIIYGAGVRLKHFIKNNHGREYIAIIDRNQELIGTEYLGIPVTGVDILKHVSYDEVVVVISDLSVKRVLIDNGCDPNLIYYPSKDQMGEGLFYSAEVRRACLKLLSELFERADQYKINLGAEFGTALGLYRNRDLIVYDDDIDLSVPSEHFEHLLEVFHKKKFAHDLSFCLDDDRGGSASLLGQIIINNVTVPICIYQRFSNGHMSYCTGEIFGQLRSELFNSRTSIELIFGKFWLPGDIELYLLDLYGDDWMIEKRKWSFCSYANV